MKKVALVLSGGGTRGLSHIGVLKVLDQLDIKIDYIAGCSIGAIIGAAYAAGKSGQEIEDFILSQKTYRLFNLSVSGLGLSGSKSLEKTLATWLPVKNFRQLKTPLFINATNLSQGKEVIFSKGNILAAIRASIAVPGIFVPAKIRKDHFVDGGILNQVPHSILPSDTTHFLVVNASPFEKMGTKNNLKLVDVLAASLKMMQMEITYLKLAFIPKDNLVLIEPDLHQRKLLERGKHFQAIIKQGELAASKQILELLSKLR